MHHAMSMSTNACSRTSVAKAVKQVKKAITKGILVINQRLSYNGNMSRFFKILRS